MVRRRYNHVEANFHLGFGSCLSGFIQLFDTSFCFRKDALSSLLIIEFLRSIQRNPDAFNVVLDKHFRFAR
ncbi:hypothetical protein D3C85_1558180 [compost metagenome]